MRTVTAHVFIIAALVMPGCLLWDTAISAAPPSFTTVRPVSRQVGRYEKLELRIDMNATFANPYDPDEIDLTATFTAPSGKTWSIWGFYNPSGWNRLWMVRFTPDETGEWRYTVTATDSEGSTTSDPGTFTVTGSDRHGFIHVASNNRYLAHDDGTSFYGVGMWYNDGYELYDRGNITETGLDDLVQHGANFISFYPTPLETMGSGLGRYDQNRCGRLDQLFEWCEARGLKISWNYMFHSYISEAIWGGGNARYRYNPYSLVCRSVDFFGNAEVWQYQEKLLRYIIARWGYSPNLFLWFVIDEINGTEGWTRGDQSVAEEWCRKVHNYFKEHDPWNRPTTGTQSGGVNQWWPGGYEIFDIAAREIYEAQGHPMPSTGKITPDTEDPLRDSYMTYSGEAKKLWDGFDKPAINGECGWEHTYYEPGTPQYLAMYHNALWVGLGSGLCATPFWWAYGSLVNDSVVTNQMLYFRRFVDDIDFAGREWAPAAITAGPCDAFAMQSGPMAYGWVVNMRETLADESFTLTGMPDGEYEVTLYKTWRGTPLDPRTVTCANGSLTVTIPELRTTGGRANQIGNDVAFMAVRQ